MFPSSSLLSLLLLALSTVDASPIQRDAYPVLAFAARIASVGVETLGDVDRARAATLRATVPGITHGKRSGKIIPVSNSGVTYTASVRVGSPATQYNLLIDTGSSNTWVGADKKYVKTSSSTQTSDTVNVTYGSGSFSGTEFVDKVNLGNGLVIEKQSIGVASISKGFDGVDGILGVGPTDLTRGTLSPSKQEIPTVVDNLFKDKKIAANVLGVFYEPTINIVDNLVGTGSLSFGGVESSKTVGPVTYFPITKTSPASEFWGIDQSITYGNQNILSSTAGIVDTGTTLTLLASDAFSVYKSAVGGVPDTATGLLKISKAQYSSLKPLHFHVGSEMFTLNPNAQIFPRALNTQIGGDADAIYLIVSDLGTPSGKGMDFVNGYTFLQRFYTVYDTGKQQVGIAKTAFTDAITN